MSSTVELCGFGIGDYRGFSGNQLALVGPWNKVHIITGQNNTGKSTLMRALPLLLQTMRSSSSMNVREYLFTDDDVPNGKQIESHRFSLCVHLDEVIETICDHIVPMDSSSQQTTILRELFGQDEFSRGSKDKFWLDFFISKTILGTPEKIVPSLNQFSAVQCLDNLGILAQTLCNESSAPENNYQSITRWILEHINYPPVIMIPAIRSARSSDKTKEGLLAAGEGLPERLLKVNNPETRDWDKEEAIRRRILEFIQQVLNEREVDFNVAWEGREILVRTKDAPYLPLSSLGTGIEELMIMAMTIATTSNSIICIEEPELHLHPTLLHRLISFMESDSTNRFLITTHSPSIINSTGVSITHVTKQDGVSTASSILSMTMARDVLDDLGAHASDLLQSNYVVWVEGPSDRIYVNAWIKEVNPDLVEGIHYSVMIYGGKLLSTLQASMDENADDLIRLFRINTHFCILMDSDKKSEKARINDTKRRIKNECKSIGAFAWITWGATIENTTQSTS